ncbi:MAG: LptE family protein [Acidobacteria bacterium]|nr:LptE family protein [Acidobacteriota bacterium]
MCQRSGFRSPLVAAAAIVCLLWSSGCGYALSGRGSFLPDYIKVVGIPAFENKTTVFDIDRILTDRVRTEFSSRGKYTVQPDVNSVDAILIGTISSVRLDNTAYTAASQASRVALIVTASFEFRDVRDNKVLWSNASLQFREEYQPTSATGADITAFFGQNANALERLAENFARSVVTSILEAF